MARVTVTTDHQEIRKWVEARGGYPARVKATCDKNDPGLLRIDYPGFSGEETLERISWEEFFKKFDEANLAFIYEDDPKSRFSKLVSLETVAERERKSAKKKSQRSRSKRQAQKTRARGRKTKKSAKKKRARA
jgi:hypothetical protein